MKAAPVFQHSSIDQQISTPFQISVATPFLIKLVLKEIQTSTSIRNHEMQFILSQIDCRKAKKEKIHRINDKRGTPNFPKGSTKKDVFLGIYPK